MSEEVSMNFDSLSIKVPDTRSKPKWNAKDESKIRRVFDQCDEDNSGTVSLAELFAGLAKDKALSRTLGIPADDGSDESKAEIEAIFQGLDTDGNAELDFEEFDVLHEQAKLRVAFAEMDVDGSGSIATTELKAAMQSLGYKLGDAEVASMLRSVDTDNDGTVSFPEFHSFFKSLGPDAGLYVVCGGAGRERESEREV